MISKRAVSAFLGRKLDDFDTVKKLTPQKLEKRLAALNPPIQLPDYAFFSQKVGVLIAAHRSEFLYFYDPGLGKTAMLLWITQWFKAAGIPHRTLVLVPNTANIDGWEQQVDEHTPDLKFLGLYGTSNERWELLHSGTDFDVAAINYGGFRAMLTELSEPNPKTKKRKQILQPKLAAEFATYFDGAVFDESHNLGDHQSTIYKSCKLIASKLTFGYPMTGTPFGRDPHPLWTQFNLVDNGETLGKTLGIFREAFFTSKRGYFGGVDHTFLKKMQPKLNRVLRHNSLRYKVEECHDLPPKKYIKVTTKLPADTQQWVAEAATRLKESRGDYRLTEQAFMQLRQLSSGFLNAKGEEGKIVLEMSRNVKLDLLMTYVLGIPYDCKLVIFHDFIYSAGAISAALKKEKIKHTCLNGGVKDKVGAVRKFQENPDYRVLVANSASGSSGLNLQMANYCFFYESPVDPKIREQSEKRVWRTGQKRTSIIYDFVVEGTKDRDILAFAKEGKDLMAALFKNPELREL